MLIMCFFGEEKPTFLQVGFTYLNLGFETEPET
ncbi:MAG: hypothetical protein PWP16_1513 [Eubacteriaceae bacterium]|jgi:hypothetical protein|nr:hypothetical protein [Eubacteriaceae bacterium]MDK2904349.1 hypothetical protein [Eubacteriaceae bacterium]MDK2935127.1 hypothetical protein [Eubacteriaceae bacterium]MDN5308150.1 hypothetical protein [Eubacteriaceae bacterium]